MDAPEVDGRGNMAVVISLQAHALSGGVIEGRSFLDGGAGDDTEPSESDGSPESGLGRF